METVWLARVPTALTVMARFLFPPMTAGLALIVALLETTRLATGDERHRRASDFWTTILAVTFAAGLATNVLVTLVTGTGLAGIPALGADPFGTSLTEEAALAFFLQAGSLAMLLAARDRLSSAARWFAAILVFVGSTLSVFWFVASDSFLQTPVGAALVDGRLVVTDFWAAVFNASTLPRFAHTISSAWLCGAFLVAGISARHVLAGRRGGPAGLSLKLGTLVGLAAALVVTLTGDRHARQVARTQPAKFAAMHGIEATTEGAPLVLLSLPPGQDGRHDGPELSIGRLASFLAFGSFRAPVKGLAEFPAGERPPVAATFLAFHHMVILGNVMLLELIAGAFLVWRRRAESATFWLRAMLFSIPLPLLAVQLGWMAAEVGRQPWGSPSAAIGPLPLVALVAAEAAFAAGWIVLVRRTVRRGPEEAASPVFAPLGPAAAQRS